MRNWKTRNAGKKKQPGQTIRFHRNFINPAYCPVVAVMLWLLNTGLIAHVSTPFAERAKTNVPLFPQFSYGFSGLKPFVKHNHDVVRDWLISLFKAAGYPDLVPHSIRSSGVQWAAQCFAQEWQARVSGRWALTSTAFAGYMQEGVNERDDYVTRKVEDPVWSFWVWRYGVLNMRPSGHGARRQHEAPGP